MATGYRCLECRTITQDPLIHKQREYDGLDCAPYRISVYYECPDCSHDELEEVELCRVCEQQRLMIPATAGDLCKECARHETGEEP